MSTLMFSPPAPAMTSPVTRSCAVVMVMEPAANSIICPFLSKSLIPPSVNWTAWSWLAGLAMAP
ncbi:MAG: hypothetical protein E5Y51_15630 [Mesorhizobium sp.]|nr:MAG: hypothetical protein E5Y51_15630 [Mesorhizobium sp.]